MRFQRSPSKILACLVLSWACLAGPASRAQDLGSPRWLHADADPLRYLSSEPAECVDLSGPPQRHALVEAGRLLFRHFPLPGWAAAEGLSCESCHAGGRARNDFHLSSRSAAPGSVDLNTGDGLGPAPIPPVLDLAPGPALRERLAGHLAGDFDSPVPSEALLDALEAYVGALSSSWCPEPVRVPLVVESELYEITRIINTLQYYFEIEDEDLSGHLAGILRQRLRALAARFESVPALAGEIAAFEARLPGEGQVNHFPASAADGRLALRRWQRLWLAFAPALLAAREESLYDRERLEAWLRRP